MNTINLRVYRRSREDIVLVWNSKTLVSEHIDNVDIIMDNKSLHTVLKSVGKDQGSTNGIPSGSIMALIPYAENNLNPDSEYFITVVLGKLKPIRQQIQVFPCGILPSKTQDDSKKISLLYGYDTNEKKWQKINLINKDGVFCLPVYIVGSDVEKKKSKTK